MSISITGKIQRVPPMTILRGLQLTDLVADSDLAPTEQWPQGITSLWRRGVSTRKTEVTLKDNQLSVRMFSLASGTDCELAINLVRLFEIEGPIDADELGIYPDVEGLAACADFERVKERAESAANVLKQLVEDGKGPIEISGPVRPVYIGKRVLEELAQQDGSVGETLLAFIKKIQWGIDDKYETAGLFLAKPGKSTEQFGEDVEWRIAMWLPERDFIMPKVDRIVVQAGEDETFMIHPEHAQQLAGNRWNLIDECQAQVDSMSGAQWASFIEGARAVVT